MPWKASSVMEERLRFVARVLDGEAMTDVCRDFGISRKTGYKIFDRYRECGLQGLTDRSRRPYTGLPDIDYPLHDKTIVVTRCGRICLGKKKINFSQVFAGQAVGIKEVGNQSVWILLSSGP